MTEKGSESYDHILKYTGVFGGVQGLNIAFGLVRNKCIALLLGPSGMGLASLFNTTVQFISQATNLGISFSAVKHVSELFDGGDEQRIAHFIKVVRAWSLLTALLGMLVCIVAGPLLSNYTFSWGDHSLHFILLSPAVALLAITGGETAILKGARQLKALAVVQVYSVFAALLISVPVYYVFGESGIVPVIVLMALATMLFTIRYSYRLYPLHLRGARGVLGEGMEMVRLGVAFVLAGILGSGADFLVRAYLNNVGDLEVVGLYNVGFMMTLTYGGLVFSAMETDYFPRLSAVNKDGVLSNQMVNRQIEVSLLIMAPMLVAFQFAIPIMIPLLFTSAFMPVAMMMRITSLALYLRAVKLPVSYLTLAKGDARSYLLLEAVYDVLMVVLVVLGYQLGGLEGTGVALLAASVADFFIIYSYTHHRYGYLPTWSVASYSAMQMALGLLTFACAIHLQGALYYVSGVILFALSLGLSLYILRSKTSLWNKLTSRLKDRFRHG